MDTRQITTRLLSAYLFGVFADDTTRMHPGLDGFERQWIGSHSYAWARFQIEQVPPPVNTENFVPSSTKAAHLDETEIIYVSDEEVGICGGVITLARRKNLDAKTRKLLLNWTTLRPLRMIRPNVRAKPSNLRPIVIDGSNVSYHEGLYYGSRLETCVEVFTRAGHEVRAFVPQFRTMHSSTREPEILDELEDSGFLVLTPSRSIDNQRLTPYDDRFIVEYANLTGAVIVSNDRFSDLCLENESWRETIRRRLSFCWYDEQIYFLKHPLGEDGPTLREFLRSEIITCT